MLVLSTIIAQRDGNLPVFSVASAMLGAEFSTTKTRDPDVAVFRIKRLIPCGERKTKNSYIAKFADADDEIYNFEDQKRLLHRVC